MTVKTAIPDIHVLKVLAQEYQQMLVEAQCGIQKLLSLDPQEEEFWASSRSLIPRSPLLRVDLAASTRKLTILLTSFPRTEPNVGLGSTRNLSLVRQAGA
jgi:hypothetical protein